MKPFANDHEIKTLFQRRNRKFCSLVRSFGALDYSILDEGGDVAVDVRLN